MKFLNKKINISFKRITQIINAPFFIWVLTIVLGSLYIPHYLNTLQLNDQQKIVEQQQKYTYGVELLNLSYKNLYLARNYYLNYKSEPDFNQRKDVLWNDYQSSVKDWNYNLVTNLFIVGQYYGSPTRIYFETEVKSNLDSLHDELLNIRDGDKVDSSKIESLLNTLDNRLFIFANMLIGKFQ